MGYLQKTNEKAYKTLIKKLDLKGDNILCHIYKEQRVGVLVDIQNLYYSAKVLHKRK